MDVSCAEHCRKPVPGPEQTYQYRHPPVRREEATIWFSHWVASQSASPPLSTQGSTTLPYLGTVVSMNWSQGPVSAFLLSAPSLSIYMPHFSSDLIGRCELATDFINSISFTGNIQKTGQYAPDEIYHSHCLGLTRKMNFTPMTWLQSSMNTCHQQEALGSLCPMNYPGPRAHHFPKWFWSSQHRTSCLMSLVFGWLTGISVWFVHHFSQHTDPGTQHVVKSWGSVLLLLHVASLFNHNFMAHWPLQRNSFLSRAQGPHLFSACTLPMFIPVHWAGADMQPRTKCMQTEASLKAVSLQSQDEGQVAEDQ